MSIYIEYELGDGATILIEAPEDESGEVVKVSRDIAGEIVRVKAKKKFHGCVKRHNKTSEITPKGN